MSTTALEPVAPAAAGALPVPVEKPRKKIPGIRKVALFLSQLSSEDAGTILARLRGSEVEELTAEIMQLRKVDPDDADEVLSEFETLMQARGFVGQGGADFARQVLTAGLGRERAEEILGRLDVVFTDLPFATLRHADTRQLLTFLKEEHPQIIALVLAHLPSGQSAEVLSRLAPEVQAEVAHRLATMDRTSPEMVRLVEEELSRRMGSVLVHQELSTVGGVNSLVEIMNRSDRATERSILEGLAEQDSELAERVRSQMFVFDDIVGIDDKSMQLLLREVQPNDLALALKGTRDDVRDKILRNLSERAGENLREEMELLGAVRMSSVEEAQAKVVQAVRAMEESGALVLSRGGDDDFVS